MFLLVAQRLTAGDPDSGPDLIVDGFVISFVKIFGPDVFVDPDAGPNVILDGLFSGSIEVVIRMTFMFAVALE